MATPTELAHMYFDAVRAEGGKSWVLLDYSAHFPFYEEPTAFSESIWRWLNSLPRS
jgi:hypothetical protein